MRNKLNLKIAKIGDTVKFRCGGDAMILHIEPSQRVRDCFYIKFAGTDPGRGVHYNEDGNHSFELLKFTTESEWLAARKKDITSTEVSALFGLSEYKSRLRLWMEKAGQIESDFEETAPTKWGKRLQNAIGQGIAEDEGFECYDLTGYYLRDPEARLGASMDFKVICPNRGTGLMETKSTGFFDEEFGWLKNRAPTGYEFQIQTQMNLAIEDGQDITWGCIAALDGRKNTRIYDRRPDTELWESIKEESRKFWRSIEQNEPPEPDYLVDSSLIRSLQGDIDIGRNISLTGNNRAHLLIENYKTLETVLQPSKEHVKDTESRMEAIKGELHHLMGKAETALIGDYRINARETAIDDRLQKGYKYRRFDVNKLRGKK